MKYQIVLIIVLILLPLICLAQEIKLSVFFLRYDGGLGWEVRRSSRKKGKRKK